MTYFPHGFLCISFLPQSFDILKPGRKRSHTVSPKKGGGPGAHSRREDEKWWRQGRTAGEGLPGGRMDQSTSPCQTQASPLSCDCLGPLCPVSGHDTEDSLTESPERAGPPQERAAWAAGGQPVVLRRWGWPVAPETARFLKAVVGFLSDPGKCGRWRVCLGFPPTLVPPGADSSPISRASQDEEGALLAAQPITGARNPSRRQGPVCLGCPDLPA